MIPFLIKLEGLTIHTYGTAMVAAFIICVIIALRKTPKNVLTTQDIYNFCLITMASLLFGTKLMNLITSGNMNLESLTEALKFWQRGSFSFVPAFLMAMLLIFLYCIVKKIPLLRTLDHLLPIALLGLAIHRVFGCFMAGCCYGKPTGLPWGVVFPDTCRAGLHYPGVPLHPTQLYYGITAFLIFLFLTLYKKQPQKTGDIAGLGLMMLAFSYFFITFLRGDIPGDQLIYHLTRSQYLAVGLFAAGLVIYRFRFRLSPDKNIHPPVFSPGKAINVPD